MGGEATPPSLASQTPDAGPRRWRLGVNLPLQWERWEGQSVVFQPDSGQTHYFNPVAAAALRELQDRPGSADELADRVAARLLLSRNPEFDRRLGEFLIQLYRLGLIVAADPTAAA